MPVPHFGAVLAMAEWERLAARLEAAGVDFAIPPTVRFRGEPGEQATMFFRDPSGNALEIKAMATRRICSRARDSQLPQPPNRPSR